jgi:hypothetical protein
MGDEAKVFAVRLRAADKANLERFRDQLQAQTPTIDVSLTDAVRTALAWASTVADRPAGVSRVQEKAAAAMPPLRRRGRPAKQTAAPPPPAAAPSPFFTLREDMALDEGAELPGPIPLEGIEAAPPDEQPAAPPAYEPDAAAPPPSKADERAARFAERRRRAIELAGQGKNSPEIVRALKEEGVEVSERTAQRWLAQREQGKRRKRVLVPGKLKEPAA